MERGGIAVAVTVLASLVVEGHIYAQVPWTRLILAAGAPLPLWITQIERLRRLAPWKQGLIGTVALLVPLGLAVAMSLDAADPEEVQY